MAAGKINLQKASGGVTVITGVDGTGNTEVVLPESGELVTKDYADLKVALASFIGTNQNLATSGYQKLPGGLIIQWGQSAMTSDTTATITFPIAFPSGVLSYSATLGYLLDGTYSHSIGIGSTATPKTTAVVTITSTGSPLSTGFGWLVFGY